MQAEEIKIRKAKNLISYLRDRESGYSWNSFRYSQLPPLAYERQFYKYITPNLTVQNLNTPVDFLRKFTPDGRFLISFALDQRSINVWRFLGVGNAAPLLKHEHRECISALDADRSTAKARHFLFGKLFRLKFNIKLAKDLYHRVNLHREFSLFIENGRYILLAGVGTVEHLPPAANYSKYPEMYDDLDIYTYTFFLVDLTNGKLCDIINFQYDNIVLAHNHGVSVCGHTVAVLSRYRQCITVFQHCNGKLSPVHVLGPFSLPANEDYTATTVTGLTKMKQRIFAYLYRQICRLEPLNLRHAEFEKFYKNFRMIEGMIMDKMQLLSNNLLVIRYEERKYVRAACTDNTQKFAKLYVFYSFSDDKMLKIFREDSLDLLFMLRNFCDDFRNVRSLQTNAASSSPTNNEFFRKSFNVAITTVPGGMVEAPKRFNPTIPVSSQSYAITQYLNRGLFQYDDRLISSLERPKPITTGPIAFTEQNTNLLRFRIFLEDHSEELVGPSTSAGSTTPQSLRELVAFIFHPFEPFLISIQKGAITYVVNFHIYNHSTNVQQS